MDIHFSVSKEENGKLICWLNYKEISVCCTPLQCDDHEKLRTTQHVCSLRYVTNKYYQYADLINFHYYQTRGVGVITNYADLNTSENVTMKSKLNGNYVPTSKNQNLPYMFSEYTLNIQTN